MSEKLLPDKVGPVDHIARRPLPWRTDSDITECGMPSTDVADRLVSGDEAQQRVSRIGVARASFTLCVTCLQALERELRYSRRGRADLEALKREIETVAGAPNPTPRDGGMWAHDSKRSQRKREFMCDRRRGLEAEIDAVRALVAAHRDEFDGYLAGRAEAPSLSDRRAKRRRSS